MLCIAIGVVWASVGLVHDEFTGSLDMMPSTRTCTRSGVGDEDASFIVKVQFVEVVGVGTLELVFRWGYPLQECQWPVVFIGLCVPRGVPIVPRKTARPRRSVQDGVQRLDGRAWRRGGWRRAVRPWRCA
jgi:hypothetical protein